MTTPTDRAIDRAAEVMRNKAWHASGSHVLTFGPAQTAVALHDAGLLRSEADDRNQAIADAAKALVTADQVPERLDPDAWNALVDALYEAVDVPLLEGGDS